jgi:hypothetical protein
MAGKKQNREGMSDADFAANTYFTVIYVLVLSGTKCITGYDLNKDISLKSKRRECLCQLFASFCEVSIWRYDIIQRINRSDGIRVDIKRKGYDLTSAKTSHLYGWFQVRILVPREEIRLYPPFHLLLHNAQCPNTASVPLYSPIPTLTKIVT